MVGAGPGKADLITVRGLNVLKEADVVIHDYLASNKELIEHSKKGAELICCDGLADKVISSDGFLIYQEKISNVIIAKAMEGKKVIRLKNGDSSVFSRLSQELEALTKAEIEFEIIPGVTAASGAASYAGISLTDRNFASACAFVTGHEHHRKEVSDIDWQALSKIGTIVFYMAVNNLPKVVTELIKAGKQEDTVCAIIQNATLPTQKFLNGTLRDIVQKAREERIKPPAIVIVGNVVRMEKQYNWLRKSKKVLFTGLDRERFFIQGTYFHLPLIKIKPLNDYREFDNCLINIREYDWLVFASRYGVEYFFKRLRTIGSDSRVLYGIKIAAVGNSTGNCLLDFGIKADLIPEKESSKGLIQEFEKIDIQDKKLFLPRSDISDKGLEKEFRKLGANAVTSVAYKNVMPEELPDLDLNSFDEIMFTSPSTVRNFRRRYGKVPEGVKITCIGDVTLTEAKKCKLLD